MKKAQNSSVFDNLCINTIRFLAVDAVQKANSGHPGLPLDAAPMAYVLWTRFLRHNPFNPQWFNRDRFVLSAGHGSMLLYSLLYLTGYDLPLEQLQQFRQWGSITAGHPERGLTPGVEVTTGPLGQGCGNGVGMALMEAHLAARFNRPGFELIDHYTYVLASDGDVMEGVGAESASLAGHFRLGKLIYLFDSNHMTLSASTNLTFTEDTRKRFEAHGWQVQTVKDGNDVEVLDRALVLARADQERPSLIIVNTHLGYGSPHKQDTYEAHGSPLGEEEVRLTKQNLAWPAEPPFYVPEEALTYFRHAVKRGQEAEAEWQETLADYAQVHPKLCRELHQVMGGELPPGWDRTIPTFPPDPKGMATRGASNQIMNAIMDHVPSLMGGSADLNPSTYTALEGQGTFESPATTAGSHQGAVSGSWDYAGRNLFFGVREHAMGAILNGMAAHGGAIPYGATFLIFSDYMRPPMRLAALSELHVIYVFTHDSIGLGEDGPTHQPVEQLAGLRAMPNLIVIRPCDANETAYAWRVAVTARDRPVALVLTRQNVPTLDRSRYAPAENLYRGAYVLADFLNGSADIILIAGGSEVSLITAAREKLQEQGISARVVSMPSWELFEAQPREYRESVLPPSVRVRLAVEAASPVGWHRYVGDEGGVIAVDKFGASAPAARLWQEYGFTVDNVCREAVELVQQGKELEVVGK